MNENQRKQLLMDKCYEKGVKDTLEKVRDFRANCFSLHLSKEDLVLFNNYYDMLIKSIYVFDEKLIKKHHTHKGHHRKQDDKHFKFFEELEKANKKQKGKSKEKKHKRKQTGNEKKL